MSRWNRNIAKRKKRSGANRAESRRFASRISVGLLTLGMVGALVVAANRWLQREEMERVRVVGRVILDSAEVMEQARVPDSVPTAKLDLTAIERRLVEHPFIARASVYRGEQGTLVVEVEERAPVAVVLQDGTPVYLDSAGVPLPYRFSGAAFDIPVIAGVQDGENEIDSVKAHEALRVAGDIRRWNELLYRRISEVRRQADGEYTLRLTDGGVEVLAGEPEGLAARLPKLDAFLQKVLVVHGVHDARSIDLRWQGQVVVRWKGGAPPGRG